MINKLLKYSIPLYIFLLPWQARYLFFEYSLENPFYGGLSFYLTDILFCLIALIWLAWVWTKRKGMMARLSSLSKPVLALLILGVTFVVYAFISLYWFPFDSAAFTGFWKPFEPVAFFKWIRLAQSFVFILILATAPIRTRSIFLAIIAAGILQGLWAIQQFFLQEIPANTYLGVAEQNPQNLGVSVIEFADQRWLRSYGGFPHPNILGAFLSIAALCASAWIFDIYKQMQKFAGRWNEVTVQELRPIRLQIIASLLAFCFLLLGLLFTFSRTAWLGFAIGWGVLFLSLLYLGKTKREKRRIIYVGFKQVIAGALLLGSLTYLIGPLWTMRANDTSRLGKQSMTERAYLVDQAEQVIAQSPARGSGIGSYIVKIRELAPDEPVFLYQPVHNTWLLLWAELGWIGLLPFLAFIAFVLSLLQRIGKKEDLSLNHLIIFSALSAFGVMLYFEHFWWTLLFGSLFASIWIGLFVKTLLNK